MKIGPGLLVTAAFIGPGTVLTASKSGASFGFALLWVVVFSVIATIIFQDMSARLGIVTKHGLGEALQHTLRQPITRWVGVVLVISAILIGNAAYESGNIKGAVEGVRILFADGTTDKSADNNGQPAAKNGDVNKVASPGKPAKTMDHSSGVAAKIITVVLSLIAFALLMTGRFKLIQWILIPLVVLMSLFFVLAMLLSQPDWWAVGKGFMPGWPPGAFWLFIGLVGTTVVPYNLFLHASGAAEQWKDEQDVNVALRNSRFDTIFAVALGGLVTSAILITASESFYGSETKLTSAGQISEQIKPVLGQYAQVFFCFGLFAAGLTSTITAPLAAAMATSGCLGRTTDPSDLMNRIIMSLVIAVGMAVSLWNISATQLIFFAQVANGFILPLIACFLLYAMNQSTLLKGHTNTILANIMGGFVLVFVTGLVGIKMFRLFFG